MYITDITEEHINELMNEISSFNDLPLTTYSKVIKDLKKIKNKQKFIESSFLVLIFMANFELYPIKELKDDALKFIEKDFSDMPLFVNELMGYNWIPILARWRLRINL